MGRDLKYGVVLRGEGLEPQYIHDDKLVFFQRPKSCGGFWLVRTYQRYYLFEIPFPVSQAQGIDYIIGLDAVVGGQQYYDGRKDDFVLTSPPS
jgi:hypothetical protein